MASAARFASHLGTTPPVYQLPRCGGGSHRRTRTIHREHVQLRTGALRNQKNTNNSNRTRVAAHAPCSTVRLLFTSSSSEIMQFLISLFFSIREDSLHVRWAREARHLYFCPALLQICKSKFTLQVTSLCSRKGLEEMELEF